MPDSIKKPAIKLLEYPRLLWDAAKLWNNQSPFRLGAVVAYYAVLSLPGLLVIIINTIGAIYGVEIVRGEITGQISDAIGESAAESAISIIENSQEDRRTIWSNIIGIGILIFGATGVFYQLQISMNEIWSVKVDPKSGVLKVLKDRALSLAFLMAVVFLLIISFVASAALALLNVYLSEIWQPAYVVIAKILDFGLSTVVLGFLFLLIFKYMPDVTIPWSSVWLGGLITAVLFNFGKFAISFYFGASDPASVYGAAGSVVLILLWVSYSCLILFYGAAFTRIYAERMGHEVHAKEQRMIVKEVEVVIERGDDCVEKDK
jgi:membrane protein